MCHLDRSKHLSTLLYTTTNVADAPKHVCRGRAPTPAHTPSPAYSKHRWCSPCLQKAMPPTTFIVTVVCSRGPWLYSTGIVSPSLSLPSAPGSVLALSVTFLVPIARLVHDEKCFVFSETGAQIVLGSVPAAMSTCPWQHHPPPLW